MNDASYQYTSGVELEDLQLILEKIPKSVWGVLSGQRIFITGGTGFVGCWLLEALLYAHEQMNLNLSIYVLTRNPLAFIQKAPHLAKHPVVELLEGNVTDLSHVNNRFNIIIHAATDVVKPDSDSVTVYDDIVNGTKQTLELAKRVGATHYLLTSSGAVYGQQPITLSHVPESYLGAPDTSKINSAYGQAKRISEWMASCYQQELSFNLKIARCFALIGPYLPLNAQFAIGNFIDNGLHDQDIHVNGDGTAVRSYLYAADMVVWLLTMLGDQNNKNCYNLGSAESLTIKSLAEKTSDIFYQKNRVVLSALPQKNGVSNYYVPDISKAKNELGLDQYTDLSTAILKTINWHRQNTD